MNSRHIIPECDQALRVLSDFWRLPAEVKSMEKSCKSASYEWHCLCIILGGSMVGPVRFHEDIQNGR
jgi:hypothetical protein